MDRVRLDRVPLDWRNFLIALTGGALKRHARWIGLSLFLAAIPSLAGATDGAFILPTSAGPSMFKQCSRPTPQGVQGYWTPSASQIEKFELALDAHFAYHPVPGPRFQMGGYHRQYIGFVKSGKRYVYGNFYPAPRAHENRDDHEATQPAGVCDGGNAFWGAVYSVQGDEVTDVQFNGEA